MTATSVAIRRFLISGMWSVTPARARPRVDRTGFTVSILDGEGALQTTLGFTREAEADAWVTQATRMNKSWAPGRSFGKTKYP